MVKLLSGLMAAAGLSWTNWLAVVTVAQAVIDAVPEATPTMPSMPSSNGSVRGAACVPLAGGLVHVIQHSTISQVRPEAKQCLLQPLPLKLGKLHL
jgi:hypothetical protein